MPTELIDTSPQAFLYFLDFLDNLAEQEPERFPQNSELIELLAMAGWLTKTRDIREWGVPHAQTVLKVWFRLGASSGTDTEIRRDCRITQLGRTAQFYATIATIVLSFAETSPRKATELLNAIHELYGLNHDEVKRALIRYPRIYARYFRFNSLSLASIADAAGDEELR